MKEIELPLGLDVQHTYDYLLKQAQEHREPVCGKFNEWFVNSTMSEDEIYVTITGHPKEYIEEKKKQDSIAYETHKKEFEAKIPELCENVMTLVLANGLIDKSKKAEFEKILNYRFHDIYEGMEIYSMIEINKILRDNKKNKNEAMRLAKEKFDEQGHSGHSAYLTALLVYNYSPVFGEEFYTHVFQGK